MSSSSFSLGIASTLVAAVFLASVLCVPALGQESAQATAAIPLITQPVDESNLTTLKGNTYPLARPEFDLGSAPASQPMSRMLLVLKRSDDQEAGLRKLLDDQQDRASPNYHKWLTPQQFGRQFGPADIDMRTIIAWLQFHGFQVGSTKGRTVLEFSGSASQGTGGVSHNDSQVLSKRTTILGECKRPADSGGVDARGGGCIHAAQLL